MNVLLRTKCTVARCGLRGAAVPRGAGRSFRTFSTTTTSTTSDPDASNAAAAATAATSTEEAEPAIKDESAPSFTPNNTPRPVASLFSTSASFPEPAPLSGEGDTTASAAAAARSPGAHREEVIQPRASNPLQYRHEIMEAQRQNKKPPRASNPAAFRPRPGGGNAAAEFAFARPKASNPKGFETKFMNSNGKGISYNNNNNNNNDGSYFRHDPKHSARASHRPMNRPLPRRQQQQQQLPSVWSDPPKLGEHLQAANEPVACSTWISIQGISPVSTLDAMLASVNAALEAEQTKGMIDLDAPWSEGEPIPFLEPPPEPAEATNKEDKQYKWVRKAKVILSPFGRPKGWYMQFDNRSVVHSLLKHVQATPIKCAWKDVTVTEYRSTDGRVDAAPEPGNIPRDEVLNDEVSDHTLRVENVPRLQTSKLVHFFRRYDLQSVQQWKGQTSNGKTAPSSIYLVHFDDASWARAALREVQATYMTQNGEQVVVDRSKPMPLRLSQFPKQLL